MSLKREQKIGEGSNSGRWAVQRKLGEGGFAEVYEVKDSVNNLKEALKIEKVDKQIQRAGLLRAEYKVIKKLQESSNICSLVEGGFGVHEGRTYFIMELLGANLAQKQRASSVGRWTLATVCDIGVEMLACIQSVHRGGYLHRDIKPANFTELSQGLSAENSLWKIVDFGLAKRFLADDGKIAPERTKFKEFRGSTTYASVHAHQKQDLGRRDDLWSWLYIMVEMLDGMLLWRPERFDTKPAAAVEKEIAKEQVLQLKRDCITDPKLLTTSVACPGSLFGSVFTLISNYLTTLAFEAEPDYAFLVTSLQGAKTEVGTEQSNSVAPTLPCKAGQCKHRKWQQVGAKRHSIAIKNASESKRRERFETSLQSAPPGYQPQERLASMAHMLLHNPLGPSEDESKACPHLSEIGQLAKSGWLSPRAANVMTALGNLDPAEGLGIIALTVEQLGSTRLEVSGQQVVAKWLQQLAGFTSQVALEMQSSPCL